MIAQKLLLGSWTGPEKLIKLIHQNIYFIKSYQTDRQADRHIPPPIHTQMGKKFYVLFDTFYFATFVKDKA
jgi:hypothetical protein